MATATEPRRSARERLLDAADELFYAEGVNVVGIDRIIDKAGVAKASLYNTYGSKDELVRAYLSRRADGVITRIRAAADKHRDPKRRVLAVYDAQAEWMARPSYNGCAFAGASAQAGADSVTMLSTREYRDRIREVITELVRETGAARPTELGRQLHMLYDGAAQAGRFDGGRSALTAKAAAAALLDAAL